MRIVLLQENNWTKKGPHDQHHLAEKLSLKGHEVRIIDHELFWGKDGKRNLYSRPETFSAVSRVYDGARVTVIRPGFIRIPVLDNVSLLLSHRNEIYRQIKEFAPDVLIGFGILNSYLAMKAGKKKNVPFVYYWTDVWHLFIPSRLYQPVGEFLERRTLRQADVVIATNKKLWDRLIKMGAHPQRTCILRKGVDFNRFNPDLNGSLVRERYGINQNDIVLLFVGTLSSFSGLREVALELTKVNDPRLKLMLVGEGELYGELQMIREEYCLQERLILTGRQPYDDVPSLIAASDICLLPFHYIETTRDIAPMKIYDYMAMKKPVISTKLPGMIAEFGENNGVVYVDKPADIIEKALELAARENLAELGARVREKFVEGYSWDNITAELERILKDAIQRKRSKVVGNEDTASI